MKTINRLLTNICSENLTASKNFYTKLFDFTVDYDSDWFVHLISKDKNRLIEAKELLTARIDNPPTINELSKLVALNEYKLKRGFKELFGTTVFGYIHQSRMDLAKRLLLGTSKTAKEIAYETGYGSPQHFSKAFKKQFGIPPNSIRNTPDSTTDKSDNPSNLNP